MRTWTEENQLFALGCNRGGVEEFEKKVQYSGLSCICGPSGIPIAQGPEDKGSVIISDEVDLAEIPDPSSKHGDGIGTGDQKHTS
ncbi:MAG TPA: hypothetical protein VMW36_03995 [Patescibacteria group bacterium]|nr:hypothetical protein [Patescibacteria group bacterium]